MSPVRLTAHRRASSGSSGRTSSATTSTVPLSANRWIRPCAISPLAPVTSTMGLRVMLPHRPGYVSRANPVLPARKRYVGGWVDPRPGEAFGEHGLSGARSEVRDSTARRRGHRSHQLEAGYQREPSTVDGRVPGHHVLNSIAFFRVRSVSPSRRSPGGSIAPPASCFARTVRTGQGASVTTRAATLPRKNRPKPVRP